MSGYILHTFLFFWCGTFRPLLASKTGSQGVNCWVNLHVVSGGMEALHKSNITGKKMLVADLEAKWTLRESNNQQMKTELNRSGWSDMGVLDKTRISVLVVSENSTEEYPWSHYVQVPACSTTTWERCPFPTLNKQKTQLDWTQEFDFCLH